MLIAEKERLMYFQVQILVRSVFFGQNGFGVLIRGHLDMFFLCTLLRWSTCLFEKGLVQGLKTGKGEINWKLRTRK